MSYRCGICAEEHDDLPDIGFARPHYYFEVPEEERARRVQLTPDTCVIDGDEFFIRGVLEVPVHDYEHSLGFGVWVSQKKENFAAYLAHPRSSTIGPFFGWLATLIRAYDPSTLNLKATAHFQGGNQRPLIHLEPADHPLAIDHHEGITLARAWEIVHLCTAPLH